MVNKPFLSRLALGASFFALCVIAFGAFTRLIDAGLGCPDWPGCYGHLSVPLSQTAQHSADLNYPATPLIVDKAWAEMVHRYFVGALSVLIVGIVLCIFCNKKLRTRGNIFLAVIIILLLAYQIILGQWTVTLKLLPLVVTQHLLGGFFVLSILWLIYLNNARRHHRSGVLSQRTKKILLPFACIAFVLLLLQITLGAWTSTNYASLSCPHFPFCFHHQAMTLNFREAFNIFSPAGVNYDGGVLPEIARQTIQMTHRFGALVLTTYLFIFMLAALSVLKKFPELITAIYVVLGLLCIQLCIGISNVTFKLPLVIALSHNLLAVLLLLSLMTFIFKLAVYPSGGKLK